MENNNKLSDSFTEKLTQTEEFKETLALPSNTRVWIPAGPFAWPKLEGAICDSRIERNVLRLLTLPTHDCDSKSTEGKPMKL